MSSARSDSGIGIGAESSPKALLSTVPPGSLAARVRGSRTAAWGGEEDVRDDAVDVKKVSQRR